MAGSEASDRMAMVDASLHESANGVQAETVAKDPETTLARARLNSAFEASMSLAIAGPMVPAVSPPLWMGWNMLNSPRIAVPRAMNRTNMICCWWSCYVVGGKLCEATW